MARLRFPGRPGQRFGRSLIRFMPEEARNSRNRFFNLTANIQKNLRRFYDVFGESDEEDDFHGFTPYEVGAPPDKELSEAFDDGDFSLLFELPEGKVSTRLECARQSLEALPTSERTRHRLKTVVRRSYLDMHRGTDGSRRQTHAIKKVQDIGSGKDALHKVKNVQMKAKDRIPTVMGQRVPPKKPRDPDKPKSIKFRFKLMRGGKRAKILCSPEKQALAKAAAGEKTSKKDKAKELLAKARSRSRQRKGQKVVSGHDATATSPLEGKRNVKMSRKLTDMMVTGVADMHFLHRTTSPPPGQSPPLSPSPSASPSSVRRNILPSSPSPARVPRQFVLPQKSSRSSRVIKPAKRFIEEVGAETPPRKQTRVEAEAISREVKQELLDSGEEFVSPDGFKKPWPKQRVTSVSSSEQGIGVTSSSSLKSSKVVSTKVKKVFGEKQLKASKTAQLVKKSHVTIDGEEIQVEILDPVAKKVKSSHLTAEKTKLLEKRRKEKLKAKKAKLLEKKQKEKRKKLEAKRKKKEKLSLSKKKAKLKKSKSPKKSKDIDKDRDGVGKSKSPKKNKDVDKERDGVTKPSEVKKSKDEIKKKEKKQKKDKEEKKDKDEKKDTTEKKDEQAEMSMESPSKLFDEMADIKKSPRKVKKAEKRRLKEEAKQLKKSYNELKKSLENFTDGDIDQDVSERVQSPDSPEDSERRKKLKELAKRHKYVCKALRKIQKENIPHIKDDSKEGKKKDHKKADRDRSKNLADKILKKAKERMGLVDTTLQREIHKEQKENVGPMKSPTELSAIKNAAMAEGASRAIADLVCRQMAEAMEADMSPEQAKAASQREMKRRRQQLKEQKSRSKSSRGPRIKHVSRRASVALGYSPAKYSEEDSPPIPDFALSALSPTEKRRLFEPNRESVRWSSDDEGAKTNKADKDFILESVQKRRPLSRKRPFSKNPFGPKKFKPLKRLAAPTVGLEGDKPPPPPRVFKRGRNAPLGKRGRRCGECEGCLEAADCETCSNCLDKPKYGGPGTKKQCCIYRKCQNLRKAAPPVDRSRHPLGTRESRPGSLISELTSFDRILVQRSSSPASARSSSPASAAGSLVPGPSGSGPVGPKVKRPSAQGVAKTMLLRDRKKKGGLKELEIRRDSPSPPPPKLKLSIQQELSKHLIKIDFQEDYDLDIAWMRGMAIVSSQPMIPRTVCYLCGSTGKHQLVYCNVCCEPYHEFCLDEEERPLEGDLDKWCCRMCRFCSVCGRQEHLLNCAKCQTSYHAECLGPNYPTKPSKRRKIWVCTKCVKCKSCGATTPGQHSSAQWSHDFSLCQDCGKLFDKGNYCPICSKCYEDDDYESKMMECAKCKSWIHAKCEGLTDDMYHILTDLPDSVPYVCVVCDPVRPAKWQVELSEEMQAGFLNVMTAVFSCKSASHLIWPDKKKHKSHRSKSPADSSRRSTGSPSLSDITTRSSTPLEGSCDSDSLQSNLRVINATSVKSDSPTMSSALSRVDRISASKEGNTKSTTESPDETSVTNKPEHAEQLKIEKSEAGKADDRTEGLGETDGATATVVAGVSNLDDSTAMEDSCDNAQDTACDKHPASSQSGTPSAEGSGETEKSTDNQSENRTREESSEMKAAPAADSSERTMPSVDEAQRTSTPCVPEEKCNDDAVLASMETSVEETEAKQSDIVIAETKATECRAESSLSEGSSKASCTEIIKDNASEEKTSSSEKSSASVLETSKSESSVSAQMSSNDKEQNNPTETGDDRAAEISAQGPDRTTIPSTSTAVATTTDSPMQSNVQQPTRPDSSNPDSTSLDQTDASKKSESADQTDGDLSVSESIEDASVLGTPANRSRSESTDSAPETEIAEAVLNAAGSRRVTRLSLQQSKTPDVSQPGLTVIRPRLNSPPPTSNLLLPSSSLGGVLGDASVMKLMASVIDKVMLGEPLNSLAGAQMVSVQQTQNQVQPMITSPVMESKPAENKNYPKDFQIVKAKVQAGSYKSVGDFCDDCVRILQVSMLKESSQTQRKNNRVARTVFTKIMEKMFPWFKVNNSSAWEESVKFPDCMLPDAVLPPHRDHEYAQWKYRTQHIPNALQPSPLKKFTSISTKKVSDTASEGDSDRTETPPPDPSIEDLRRCSLCGQYSDDEPNNAGRLLYCGQNDWIHINCALWSAEVFEEVDGSLMNVHTAASRGRLMKCDFCHKVGATVGCCTPNCPANYHFMCARRVNALFQEDKKVFCARHGRMVRKKLVDNDMFAVLRRVCVSFESIKMNKNFINGLQVNRINFMVGSLTLDSLGRLGPLSETKENLFPIDYRIQRVFWSTQDPRRRCVYTVRITEVKPEKVAQARIIEETNLTTSHDPTYDALQLQKSNMLLKIADDSLSNSCPSFRKSRKSSVEDRLSLSWPAQSTRGLSEKTLKNLPKSVLRDLNTPSPVTTLPCSPEDEEEEDLTLNLNQMVMSLNKAASKSHADEQNSKTSETTSDTSKNIADESGANTDVVESINIELDDSLLGAIQTDGNLSSVEKLIGEVLSEEQSLDEVVLLVENLHNSMDDETSLAVDSSLGMDADTSESSSPEKSVTDEGEDLGDTTGKSVPAEKSDEDNSKAEDLKSTGNSIPSKESSTDNSRIDEGEDLGDTSKSVPAEKSDKDDSKAEDLEGTGNSIPAKESRTNDSRTDEGEDLGDTGKSVPAEKSNKDDSKAEDIEGTGNMIPAKESSTDNSRIDEGEDLGDTSKSVPSEKSDEDNSKAEDLKSTRNSIPATKSSADDSRADEGEDLGDSCKSVPAEKSDEDNSKAADLESTGNSIPAKQSSTDDSRTDKLEITKISIAADEKYGGDDLRPGEPEDLRDTGKSSRGDSRSDELKDAAGTCSPESEEEESSTEARPEQTLSCSMPLQVEREVDSQASEQTVMPSLVEDDSNSGTQNDDSDAGKEADEASNSSQGKEVDCAIMKGAEGQEEDGRSIEVIGQEKTFGNEDARKDGQDKTEMAEERQLSDHLRKDSTDESEIIRSDDVDGVQQVEPGKEVEDQEDSSGSAVLEDDEEMETEQDESQQQIDADTSKTATNESDLTDVTKDLHSYHHPAVVPKDGKVKDDIFRNASSQPEKESLADAETSKISADESHLEDVTKDLETTNDHTSEDSTPNATEEDATLNATTPCDGNVQDGLLPSRGGIQTDANVESGLKECIESETINAENGANVGTLTSDSEVHCSCDDDNNSIDPVEDTTPTSDAGGDQDQTSSGISEVGAGSSESSPVGSDHSRHEVEESGVSVSSDVDVIQEDLTEYPNTMSPNDASSEQDDVSVNQDCETKAPESDSNLSTTEEKEDTCNTTLMASTRNDDTVLCDSTVNEQEGTVHTERESEIELTKIKVAGKDITTVDVVEVQEQRTESPQIEKLKVSVADLDTLEPDSSSSDTSTMEKSSLLKEIGVIDVPAGSGDAKKTVEYYGEKDGGIQFDDTNLDGEVIKIQQSSKPSLESQVITKDQSDTVKHLNKESEFEVAAASSSTAENSKNIFELFKMSLTKMNEDRMSGISKEKLVHQDFLVLDADDGDAPEKDRLESIDDAESGNNTENVSTDPKLVTQETDADEDQRRHEEEDGGKSEMEIVNNNKDVDPDGSDNTQGDVHPEDIAEESEPTKYGDVDSDVQVVGNDFSQKCPSLSSTPPSSPSNLDLSKTPVVVLHDLRRQSSIDSLSNDQSMHYEEDLELLSNVEELQDVPEADDDSIAEINEDSGSDCEVFSNGSDYESNHEPQPTTMLADMLEEVLPKEVKENEHVSDADTKKECLEEPGVDIVIVDSDREVDVISIAIQKDGSEESRQVCNPEETKIDSKGPQKDSNALENVENCTDNIPDNSKVEDHLENIQDSVSSDKEERNAVIEIDETQGGIIEGYGQRKDQDSNNTQEENAIQQDESEVVEADKEDEVKIVVEDAAEKATTENNVSKKPVAELEVRQEVSTEERNVFDVVYKTTVAPGTNIKEKDTNKTLKSPSKSLASDSVHCGGDVPKSSPDRNAGWVSAFNQFITKTKKNELNLKKGNKVTEKQSNMRQRHKSEPVISTGQDSHAQSSEDGRKPLESSSGKQDDNHSKRHKRTQSEKLTDFDDFVPESNLDTIDISQPGRKKYPMRSTARRLLRIAETSDEVIKQGKDGNDDVAAEEQCEEVVAIIDDENETQTRRLSRTRSHSGVSEGSENSDKVEVKESSDSPQTMEKSSESQVVKRGRGRPPKNKNRNIVANTPSSEPRRSHKKKVINKEGVVDTPSSEPRRSHKKKVINKEEVADTPSSEPRRSHKKKVINKEVVADTPSSEPRRSHKKKVINNEGVVDTPSSEPRRSHKKKVINQEGVADTPSSEPRRSHKKKVTIKETDTPKSEPRRSTRQPSLRNHPEIEVLKIESSKSDGTEDTTPDVKRGKEVNENKDENNISKIDSTPPVKRGRGRPRKHKIITDQHIEEEDIIEVEDDLPSERQLREREAKEKYNKVHASDEEGVADEEEENQSDKTGRRCLRSARKEEEDSSGDQSDDVDDTPVFVSGRGRTRKAKLHTDFIQVGDDVETDEDDFILADDPPPPKPRGRHRKPKRVGSLSWKKDKNLDPEWSPEMGESTSGKKGPKKPAKSPERRASVKSPERKTESQEDKNLDPKCLLEMSESTNLRRGLKKPAKSPERRAGEESSESEEDKSLDPDWGPKVATGGSSDRDSAAYKKALKDLTELALRRKNLSAEEAKISAEKTENMGKRKEKKLVKLSTCLPQLPKPIKRRGGPGRGHKGPWKDRYIMPNHVEEHEDVLSKEAASQDEVSTDASKTSDKLVKSKEGGVDVDQVKENKVSSQDLTKKDIAGKPAPKAEDHQEAKPATQEAGVNPVVDLCQDEEANTIHKEKVAESSSLATKVDKPVAAEEEKVAKEVSPPGDVDTSERLTTAELLLELSSPKKDSPPRPGSVTSPQLKVPHQEPAIVSADMTTPTKPPCVPSPQTSPILRAYLTSTSSKEKSASPEIVELTDSRQSPENTAELKSDQVFIPTLSPRSEAPRLPMQPLRSPPQTPKMSRVPRSPILPSPTPLPPPQYYTIVQPVSKEKSFSLPSGMDSPNFGPMRVRGRIRMRGGRQPAVQTPTSPFLCETRLNRPPTMQVIPTLSPLHQVQSLQSKMVVQKDVINNSGFVVSGSTLQPVQQVLSTQGITPTAIHLPGSFQISPPSAVVPQVPIVGPIQSLSPPDVQIINTSPPAILQVHAPPSQMPVQLMAPRPNCITVQVTAAQPVHSNQPAFGNQSVLSNRPVISNPVIVQHQPRSIVVTTTSNIMAPQVSAITHNAIPGSGLLPTNAQLMASGIIPSQGVMSHHAPSSTVEPMPRTTPTVSDRQHYVSILRQYSNSLRTKSQALNNPMLSTNQLSTSALAATLGLTGPQTAVVSNSLSNSLPQLHTQIVQHSTALPLPMGPTQHLPHRSTPLGPTQHIPQGSTTLGPTQHIPQWSKPLGPTLRHSSQHLPQVSQQNSLFASPRSNAGVNPFATNMLNTLAQQHMTDARLSRPRILAPAGTRGIVQSSQDHAVYGGSSVVNASNVWTERMPHQGNNMAPGSNLGTQGNTNQHNNTSQITPKRPVFDSERLTGAKKRKTAHSGSVWFDTYGRLHGTLEQLSEEELREIKETGKVPAKPTRMPSYSAMARTKVPTFGPSKDTDRVVIGGGIDSQSGVVDGDVRMQAKMRSPPYHHGSDGPANPTMEGMFQLQSASRLRTHIVPKRRHDKWAAPPPAAPLPTKTQHVPSLLDLESTEQSTVQSDFDEDEKMSIPPEEDAEEDDDAPSLLLQIMEAESKRPKTSENKENDPHLVFEVTSDDGFHAKGKTMEEAWSKVIQKVEERRSDTRMTNLSFAGINPLKILGVSHDSMVFLIEQLYGAKNCRNYKFRYHQYYDAELDEEPELNPHGCARSETFKQRNYYDMFNFLASKHRKRPQLKDADNEQDETMHKSARRATSISDLPMAMRFRHLKETAKEAVGVFRSRIHGRGLFCRRTIDAGEMVIEYTGTVIRSILTDKREKYYESKGIGCYMFRIDDYDVIDATMHGSAARFINHSCEPNCFSRVIQVGTSKHIVIFASRKIYTGEELTYDYKFPIEEVKIPCNCQAPRCRKYLN